MPPFSITAGLIPRSLLRKELFPDLLESVIPECFYPSISLGTVRFSNRRESRRDRRLDPTIKTFGGDAFGINSHRYVLIPRQLAAG